MRTLLCLVLLTSAPALAQQPDAKAQAEALYTEGVELFQKRQFEEAAGKFQQAYNIDPSPILLYNLARAAEELGDANTAVGHYRAYLARFPEAEDEEEVERRIRTLEKIIEEARRGFLALDGLPEGAVVQIDGAALDAEPDGRWKLKPGEHKVEVTSEGESPWVVTAAIRDADTTRLTHPAAVKAPPPPPDEGGGISGMAIAGWTSVGIGAVGLGLGTVFYFQALGAADDYDTARREVAVTSGDARDEAIADQDAAEDTFNSSGTLTYVFWGVGVAAAATGAVLLVLDGDDEGASASLVPAPGGLGLVGTF